MAMRRLVSQQWAKPRLDYSACTYSASSHRALAGRSMSICKQSFGLGSLIHKFRRHAYPPHAAISTAALSVHPHHHRRNVCMRASSSDTNGYAVPASETAIIHEDPNFQPLGNDGLPHRGPPHKHHWVGFVRSVNRSQSLDQLLSKHFPYKNPNSILIAFHSATFVANLGCHLCSSKNDHGDGCVSTPH
jgi:hypothetical protein